MASFWDDLKGIVKDATPELKAVASRELKSAATKILNKDKNSPPVSVAVSPAAYTNIGGVDIQPYLVPAAVILVLVLILKK